MKVVVRFIYYEPVTPSCDIIDMDDETWKVFLDADLEKRIEIAMKIIGKEFGKDNVKEMAWIPLDDQGKITEKTTSEKPRPIEGGAEEGTVRGGEIMEAIGSKIKKRIWCLQKAILEQYSQIETNVQYTSLWVAKKGKKFWIRFFQVLSIVLNAIPLIVELLIAVDVIKTDNHSVWIVIFVLLFAIVLSGFNYFGLETISALNDEKSKALMRLNNDFAAYKFKLEDMYYETMSINSVEDLKELQDKFAKLRDSYIDKETAHDDLTGVLDKKLAKQAFDIALTNMRNKKLYIDNEPE